MANQGEPPLIRAAIYLRISQDHTGEALGVSRQLEDCTELATLLEWQIAETYTDNDTSATSGKPRPEYRRMLADIDAGNLDAIIAWHPDRLYRVVPDLGELVEVCKRNGTQIATAKAGNIDLTTPTGRLVAGLLAQVATYEGEAKADRWKRSWRQGREAGRVPGTGSRLFGYTREGEVIEWEAEIARRMAADVVGGVPILTVSRWLEAEGILTTRDGVWRTAAVRKYLANPRLAGFSTLNGDIVGEGQWQPILDRDTWETVRALLSSRARGAVPRRSLLNGLIHCGACGHRMITSGNRGKRTYRCPNRPGMPGCGRISGDAENIEEVVESYARARLSDPRVRKAITALSNTGAPEALTEIANLEARITELEEQLDEPGVPVKTILRAIDRSRERLEQCQAKLAASTPVHLPDPEADWPTDLERRRSLVDVVVQRVNLRPGKAVNRRFDPTRVEIVGR